MSLLPPLTRRTLLRQMAAASVATQLPFAKAATANPVHPGKFQANRASLRQWQIPEWFRDAKFGIWAHWSAQCVPEQGDWYARQMYIQGHPQYEYHCKTYGHPSKVGFMQIDHLWRAESWQPEQLMDLYVAAGAKYFMALACHHDNLDCYDSTYHHWNTTRVGPGKDIVGTWEKLVRERGLRFGVSNHSAHAWHWLQTAYDYDPEGPLAGVRYDAYTLTRADGKGKWWDGLDPQELYTGRNIVAPDGIKTIREMDAWHESHDRKWVETPPPNNPEFTRTWYLRCQELVDKYKPDLLYFDDTGLPLGQTGLDIAAHFYNASMQWHNGNEEAVVTGKAFTSEDAGIALLDIERGRAQGILDNAWQTDTCIGDWHYSRAIYDKHEYKTANSVVQTLVDIVSKNGNLMLNIPLRGNGMIDEDEHAFLQSLARWMSVHGQAIYGTRPFAVYGEGPPDVSNSSNFNESSARPFTASDIRFTTKGSELYVFALGWPADGTVRVHTLAKGASVFPKPVQSVEMLGVPGKLKFQQDAQGLSIQLPARPSDHLDAYAFRVLV